MPWAFTGIWELRFIGGPIAVRRGPYLLLYRGTAGTENST